MTTAVVRPWTGDWSALGGSVDMAGQMLPAWLPAGWIVLISTVFAYLTGIVAVRKLSAPVAGGIAFLEPAVAVVLAWWLLGEHLGPAQLIGGALVLTGAYVAQRSASGKGQRLEPDPLTGSA